jgi:hypothetical protein
VAKAIRIIGSAEGGSSVLAVDGEGIIVAGTVGDTIGVLEAVGFGNGVGEGSIVEKIDGMRDIAVPVFCAAGGLAFGVEAPHAVNIINPRDAIT